MRKTVVSRLSGLVLVTLLASCASGYTVGSSEPAASVGGCRNEKCNSQSNCNCVKFCNCGGETQCKK